MNHLSVVEAPLEPPVKTERMLEEETVSQVFLEAFYNNLADVQDGDLPYSSHVLSSRDSATRLSSLMGDLGENEAIHVDMRDIANGNEKRILAIKRTDGTESILTFFCLHADQSGLTSARVYQEISDTSEAFNTQFDITYDKEIFSLVDYIHTSRVGRFYDREDSRGADRWNKKIREANKKKALKLLDRVTDTSPLDSIDKAVSTSISKEEDRIRSNLRGKGTVHAIAAAVIHFPDFVRQQKEAA